MKIKLLILLSFCTHMYGSEVEIYGPKNVKNAGHLEWCVFRSNTIKTASDCKTIQDVINSIFVPATKDDTDSSQPVVIDDGTEKVLLEGSNRYIPIESYLKIKLQETLYNDHVPNTLIKTMVHNIIAVHFFRTPWSELDCDHNDLKLAYELVTGKRLKLRSHRSILRRMLPCP